MRRSLRARPALLAMASSLGAVVLGLGLGVALIALSGKPAGTAIKALVDGAFGGSQQFAGTLSQAVPLAAIALAWILASAGGLFNIGLDGQVVAGGVTASAFALLVPVPAGLDLVVAVMMGVIGGMAWAAIAAGLWAWRGVSEIISTLMLNFIAIEILAWVIRGPLRDPTQAFPQSRSIPTQAVWPPISAAAGLNWDIALVLVLVVIIGVIMRFTTFGMRLRFSAASEPAARSAGIATVRVRVAALVISGGIAGMVGADLVLGGQSRVLGDGFNGTYGYDGIAVALVARNSPWAVPLVALLFAALHEGGALMEATAGVSSFLVQVMQGLVIILVAGSAFVVRRLQTERRDPRSGETAGVLPATELNPNTVA